MALWAGSLCVTLDSDSITDLSLPTDACLRCQTEGKQEECVGKNPA